MKKKLATIDIYVDDEKSFSHSLKKDNTHWETVLSPKYDDTVLRKLDIPKDTPILNIRETILAHELGHVVAMVFNDPTHSDLMAFLSRVPGEKRAWALANDISPTPLVQEIEKEAINSYEQED